MKHVGLMAAVAALLFVAVATYQLRAELGRVRAGRGQTRVAVVLFDNETGRPEMSRFAQGMTDAVVTELTAERRLAVIGNASVLRTERPFRDIGRVRDTLNAEYIVIGQVQKRDDNTIVRAHLIRARDEAHVWVDVAEWTNDGEAAFQQVVAGRVRSAVATLIRFWSFAAMRLDFAAGDIARGWDGTFNGQKLNPAVFVWQAVVEFIDGKEEIFTGDVTLQR